MDENYEAHFQGRHQFMEFIKNTKKHVCLKFTADWCGPCKQIQPIIETNFNKLKERGFICLYVDIEEYFDVYVFLKSRKMLSGIPTIFYYSPDNTCAYAPTAVIIGANEAPINNFFKQLLTKNI